MGTQLRSSAPVTGLNAELSGFHRDPTALRAWHYRLVTYRKSLGPLLSPEAPSPPAASLASHLDLAGPSSFALFRWESLVSWAGPGCRLGAASALGLGLPRARWGGPHATRSVLEGGRCGEGWQVEGAPTVLGG